jgi:hypothetical protein
MSPTRPGATAAIADRGAEIVALPGAAGRVDLAAVIADLSRRPSTNCTSKPARA